MTPRASAHPLDALDALLSLFGGMKLAMRQQLQADGGSAHPPMLLRMLQMCQQQPGITQQGLAQRSGRDKGQVARLVKELLDQGLLRRAPHPEDKRSHCLWLTATGEAACARFVQAQAGVARQLFGELSEAELDALVTQWRALRARVRSDEDDAQAM